MKQYFEYTDEKSGKFWEITLEGVSFTVRYGKIGTAGQTQTKDFDFPEIALREAEKLLKEKVKKGYIEKTNGAQSETPEPESQLLTPIKLNPLIKQKVDGSAIIDPISVPTEVLKKYEGQLPEELIELWKEDGFCGYFEGFWWTINPDDFTWLLDEWKWLEVKGIPFLRTACGDVAILDKNHRGNLYIHLINFTDRKLEYLSGDDWGQFTRYYFNETPHDKFNKPSHYDLKHTHGLVDRNHCYGYRELLDPVDLIPAADEMGITPLQECLQKMAAFQKTKLSDIIRIWGGINGKIAMEGRFVKVGTLNITSGEIIAADPLVTPDMSPFERKVPLGKYPAYAYFLTGENYDPAFVLVSFSNNEPQEWEHYSSHPVDAGVSAFFDKDTAKVIIERSKDDDEYLLGMLELDKRGEEVCLDEEHNLIAFTPGDGNYNVSFAIDKTGNPVFILTDFYGMDIDFSCDNLAWQKRKTGMTPERLRKKMQTLLSNYKTKDAISIAQQFLKKDPDDHDALYVVAEACYKDDKYDEALQTYHSIFKNHPDDAEILNQIGLCHEKLGQYNQALEAFTRLSEQSPGSWWGLYRSADILVELKRYEEALALYENVATLDPSRQKVIEEAIALVRQKPDFRSEKTKEKFLLKIVPDDNLKYKYISLIHKKFGTPMVEIKDIISLGNPVAAVDYDDDEKIRLLNSVFDGLDTLGVVYEIMYDNIGGKTEILSKEVFENVVPSPPSQRKNEIEKQLIKKGNEGKKFMPDKNGLGSIFPMSNEEGSCCIDRSIMYNLVEDVSPISKQKFKNIVKEHQEFLDYGGENGTWMSLDAGGIVFAIYQGATATKGTQGKFYLQKISGLDFSGVNLPFCDFIGCFGENIQFKGSNLKNSIFTDAHLPDCSFENCDLTGVDFSRSNLSNCCFNNCNLEKTDFENCNLEGASFIGARLEGSRFPGANLKDVVYEQTKGEQAETDWRKSVNAEHYLEFTDEKSSKFWEIILEGVSFTVRYGKIGTAGQTQTKDFDSPEIAQKEAEKLLKEKVKKGYRKI